MDNPDGPPFPVSINPFAPLLESTFSEYGVFFPIDRVDLMNITTTVINDWHLCFNVAQRHGLDEKDRRSLWEWLEDELDELARYRNEEAD